MKNSWRAKELGEVCQFQGGSQPPKSIFSNTYHQDYIRLIQIRDYKSDRHIVFIPKEKAKRLCTENDVMIGRYGPPVFQILRGLKGAYNVALMKAIPDEAQVSKDFLFYFLKTPEIQQYVVNLSSRAAGQSGVNKAALEKYPIPFPSLPEQKSVVAILDEVFAGIDEAIANTEKNLTNAREIFENYLHNLFVRKGRSWVSGKLGDFCERVEYGSSAKSKPDGKIPVLRMGNIQNGEVDWENLVYTVDESEIDRYSLKYNDVLFNRTNSDVHVGKTAIYKGERPAIFAGYLIRIHRKKDLIDADFLNFYLNSDIARAYGRSVMSRSVNQANINGTKLKEYPISVPSLTVQKEVASNLASLLTEAQRLEAIYQQKLTALNELKQSILQKAFTGELTADTAEQAKDEI